MTQHEQLIDLFRRNGNCITLGAIMQTTLAAEYRARISELRRRGYVISCETRKKKSDNVYRLVSEPGPPRPFEQAELIPATRNPMAGH